MLSQGAITQYQADALQSSRLLSMWSIVHQNASEKVILAACRGLLLLPWIGCCSARPSKGPAKPFSLCWYNCSAYDVGPHCRPSLPGQQDPAVVPPSLTHPPALTCRTRRHPNAARLPSHNTTPTKHDPLQLLLLAAKLISLHPEEPPTRSSKAQHFNCVPQHRGTREGHQRNRQVIHCSPQVM